MYICLKMLQGQPGLSTTFYVNASLSPNLPDRRSDWVWTNGRTCNCRVCNRRAQATCSLIGQRPKLGLATCAVQEVVHRKQNQATRGCVIASYCVDNSCCLYRPRTVLTWYLGIIFESLDIFPKRYLLLTHTSHTTSCGLRPNSWPWTNSWGGFILPTSWVICTLYNQTHFLSEWVSFVT